MFKNKLLRNWVIIWVVLGVILFALIPTLFLLNSNAPNSDIIDNLNAPNWQSIQTFIALVLVLILLLVLFFVFSLPIVLLFYSKKQRQNENKTLWNWIIIWLLTAIVICAIVPIYFWLANIEPGIFNVDYDVIPRQGLQPIDYVSGFFLISIFLLGAFLVSSMAIVLSLLVKNRKQKENNNEKI